MLDYQDGIPDISDRQAAEIAQNLFGISGQIVELPSERDQNFLVRSNEDMAFVLKIANSREDLSILEMQIAALEQLESKANADSFPACQPSVDDGASIVVTELGGKSHAVRMLTYIEGIPLANYRPHTDGLLEAFGRFLGSVSEGLRGFSHPAANRDLIWDLAKADEVIALGFDYVSEEQRKIIERWWERWKDKVQPVLSDLRISVVHNDANDHNVIIKPHGFFEASGFGLVDFGDMVHTYTLSELAIGAAYACLDKPDPLQTAASIVKGYHQVFPLTEIETQVLFECMVMRLCMSVVNAARQKQEMPENEYLTISEQFAWRTLGRLEQIPVGLPQVVFRASAGLPPHPHKHHVEAWLRTHLAESIVPPELSDKTSLVFDFGVGGTDLGTEDVVLDPEKQATYLFGKMKQENREYGLGRHGEVRGMYHQDVFKFTGIQGPQWRALHLGIDIYAQPGCPVFAPFDGIVYGVQNNDGPLDYGPTVILEHRMEDTQDSFYTLYGHLGTGSIDSLGDGTRIQAGEQIGAIGDTRENGGWPPHLHFQVMVDMLGYEGTFPGVVHASESTIWLGICPDPSLIIDVPIESNEIPSMAATRKDRDQFLSPSLSLAYRKPLKILRSAGQYLYDDQGRRYLDCVNNVAHVGHANPKIVAVAANQMRVLNTNTRYLHDNIVEYAARLTARLPPPLQICFFVNSGSEANDLALRLAQTHTSAKDIIVLEGAYHGNLSSLIEISPYKFNGPGGEGPPAHVHVVPTPDVYRGLYRQHEKNPGSLYADKVREEIEHIQAKNVPLCAFVAEPLMGVAGQLILPENFLIESFEAVRGAGGVCIADEVQIGFGRVGTHFWGFETQGCIPDIVTMGKPIGNGHPLGAVVTTPEIAESFLTGMEYFNTFGGNPVSCAVGKAVLEVIEEQRLQERAHQLGTKLLREIQVLKGKHELIGDVRGMGFFLGIELVLDRDTLEPAPEHAKYIVERMKDFGILLSTDGPYHNVIKIKPPMVITEEDLQFLCDTLDQVLQDSVLQLRCPTI